jgi:hypothetical protein
MRTMLRKMRSSSYNSPHGAKWNGGFLDYI